MSKDKNIMWGGRFDSAPSAIMTRINASISYDQKMAMQDIRGSKAHAKMLADQNIISKEDFLAIDEGLDKIKVEITQGAFEFSEALEDIHLNIENRLREIIGDAAGRLHTARSRNDQVATDFRLWVRDQIDTVLEGLDQLIEAFIAQAERGADMIMPGFTHLQTAQPVTFGHHMLAYAEMFLRDKNRMQDVRKRLNESPLGAAALAGTSFPIDRFATAKALDFDRPMANSLDAVSDRDFALEFLAAASIMATHLSRFAEEIVIWASKQFGFIQLSDQWSTGSSIMPQKKNPDAAELVRAKVGRITGSLVALLTIMKGLPLAYSKDMQEDKEQVFDASENLLVALAAATGIVQDMRPNVKALYGAASSGFSTATDLADWLVRVLNLPFREAHHVTGQIVRIAEDEGLELANIPLERLQSVHSAITEDVYTVLSVENSVMSRNSYGGTSPEQVKAQIKRLRE